MIYSETKLIIRGECKTGGEWPRSNVFIHINGFNELRIMYIRVLTPQLRYDIMLLLLRLQLLINPPI